MCAFIDQLCCGKPGYLLEVLLDNHLSEYEGYIV